MVRTRNVSFKLILCSIEDDTTTFNLFIDRKKYRALQLAIAAVKLATQSICISTFNTLTRAHLTFLSENQDTLDELMKKYQIKCSPDLNVDIQSAVEFTVGDGTRNIERTIYDDMSDAESDPDDEYEEEEGDEIMLEFMSTN